LHNAQFCWKTNLSEVRDPDWSRGGLSINRCFKSGASAKLQTYSVFAFGEGEKILLQISNLWAWAARLGGVDGNRRKTAGRFQKNSRFLDYADRFMIRFARNDRFLLSK